MFPCRQLKRKANAGASAQQIVPYNVPIDGHVSGFGRIQHREFVMGSGEMAEAQFTLFLKSVLGHLAHASIDGSIDFVCMDWRHSKRQN